MRGEVVQPDGPIMQIVLRVINARGWRHVRHANRAVVELSLACKHSVVGFFVTARENEQQAIVCAVIGSKVPAERRAAVAEFLSRVNFTFFVGNFDVDFDDGRVRFRAGIDVEGGALADKMVENLFDLSAYAADAYHERLMQVIYGGAHPKDVLTQHSA
jgi:hypothetical protein